MSDFPPASMIATSAAHDPADTDRAIQTLRDLHVELDTAVATAYDWQDLDLGHGFHDTKQGRRFTISDPARREVLARLLELNHTRHAAEQATSTSPRTKSAGGVGVFE